MTCVTPDDAFNAGLADADTDPPPPPDLADRVAAMLAPHQNHDSQQDPAA